MKVRDWPRLGLTEVIGLDLADDIEQTIKALTQDGHHAPEWDARWRLRAANHLRRLLRCQAAMKALQGGKGSGRRGRPREHNEIELALTYAATLELMGRDARGNPRRAVQEVARLWSVTEQTVKDAYSRHRVSEERRLAALLEQFEGKPRMKSSDESGLMTDQRWSREQLLRAISADLLEQRQRRRSDAMERQTDIEPCHPEDLKTCLAEYAVEWAQRVAPSIEATGDARRLVIRWEGAKEGAPIPGARDGDIASTTPIVARKQPANGREK